MLVLTYQGSYNVILLMLYRRQVVEGVTECTLDKGNYLPPVQYKE